LISKHAGEIKNVGEKLRSNLTLLHTGEPSVDIRALTSTTTTRRIPSPQPKSNVKSPLKFSFKDSDFFSPEKTGTQDKEESSVKHDDIQEMKIKPQEVTEENMAENHPETKEIQETHATDNQNQDIKV